MERELLLLGLLKKEEMHGYQLHEFIDSFMQTCVDLKKSTAYYLLEKMAKEGYVVFSPVTKAAFSDIGAAMADSDIRFFLVEHFLMMVIALVLAHIGRSRAKKADTDVGKHKRAAIFYTLAILLILTAVPWDHALLPF